MRTWLENLAGVAALLGGLAIVIYGLPLFVWAVNG
ncbi:hypothetical protein MMUC44124_24130 [Mycolicibacterium mucogenicum DSM 44124]|nr:hypothetical protein MMUC44124_24130 [Mycolicibacterium mucogenicum DSM 44124]